jgi:hypothetical protein
MADEPIDDPNAPTPTTDPDADPRPVSPGELPPGRVGVGVGNVALLAIVFVATLLLLLGATRLLDPGTARSSSGAVAPTPSVSLEPGRGESPFPSGGAGPSDSGNPGGSTDPGGGSGTPAATTTPTSTGDPVLVGAGDIAVCGANGDEDTAALLDATAGTVFTAGDNAYESGSARDFAQCYEPSWGRHRARTRPAPGNHDWETDGLKGYFDYFGAAAQGPDGSSWYSYDLGTWHIIVLDSVCHKVGGCDGTSPQGRWLAADLAVSNAACTMAIFHHPRFSSGEHGDQVAVDAFWRPLYAAGVDVIVNGHDHNYERFAPQDPDGKADTTRGIREFVVGSGGGELRSFVRQAANSDMRIANGYGVIAFTLHEGAYDWVFTVAGADFQDTGRQSCH